MSAFIRLSICILAFLQLLSFSAFPQVNIVKAREALDQGDMAKAEAYCQKALKKNPEEGLAYTILAIIRNDAGNYEEGLKLANKAIALNPKDDLAYFARAFAKDWLEDFEGSLADYTIAIDLNPEQDFFYYYRGLAHQTWGSQSHALADFTRASALDPDDPKHYFSAGNSRSMLGQYEEAINAFSKCLELDTTHVEACTMIAEMLIITGKYKTALYYARQALFLSNDPEPQALNSFLICVGMRLACQPTEVYDNILKEKLQADFVTEWHFVMMDHFNTQGLPAGDLAYIKTLLALFGPKRPVEEYDEEYEGYGEY